MQIGSCDDYFVYNDIQDLLCRELLDHQGVQKMLEYFFRQLGDVDIYLNLKQRNEFLHAMA